MTYSIVKLFQCFASHSLDFQLQLGLISEKYYNAEDGRPQTISREFLKVSDQIFVTAAFQMPLQPTSRTRRISLNVSSHV
jgi:hypothetical protein